MFKYDLLCKIGLTFFQSAGVNLCGRVDFASELYVSYFMSRIAVKHSIRRQGPTTKQSVSMPSLNLGHNMFLKLTRKYVTY